MEKDKTYIRYRERKQFFNTIRETVSSFTSTGEMKDRTYEEAIINTSLNELEFYRCFLYLKSSLSRTAYKHEQDTSLTPVNIDYLATIMAKPMSFTMPSKSKNNVQKNLATELNKTPKSAYSAIHRLKTKGYLVKTEDDLIMPNSELQMLRNVTKKHLDKTGSFPVSYLMEFIVTKDGSEQETTA